MRTLVAGILLSFQLLASGAHAQTKPSERALIVFLNMYTADKGAFLNRWYKSETSHALKMILGKTRGAYGDTVVLYRDQVRLSKLLEAIRKLNANPSIRAIDLIVYTHGSPTELKLVNEPGDVSQFASWNALVDISAKVRAIGSKKLRALYSDACFSAAHNEEWLKAGFKVASGSIKVDANQDRDLALFLKRWVRGEKFERGIKAANRERSAVFLDWVTKDGNSRKRFSGNGALTIASPAL